MPKRHRETTVLGEPLIIERPGEAGYIVPLVRRPADPAPLPVDGVPAVSETADRGDTKRTDANPSGRGASGRPSRA